MNWWTKRYNKKSAQKNGWHPSWFAANLTEFDEVLLNEIKKFQAGEMELEYSPRSFVNKNYSIEKYCDNVMKLLLAL